MLFTRKSFASKRPTLWGGGGTWCMNGDSQTLSVGRQGSSFRQLSKEKGLFSKILSDEGDTPRGAAEGPQSFSRAL